MWRAVRHGYCPRSHDPGEQMVEVLRRFDLAEVIAPFTRCPVCNGMLRPVEKRDILEQLEPLTRIHYDEFRRCANCGKVYWSGSHVSKLEARLERIRGRLQWCGRQTNQNSEMGDQK